MWVGWVLGCTELASTLSSTFLSTLHNKFIHWVHDLDCSAQPSNPPLPQASRIFAHGFSHTISWRTLELTTGSPVSLLHLGGFISLPRTKTWDSTLESSELFTDWSMEPCAAPKSGLAIDQDQGGIETMRFIFVLQPIASWFHVPTHRSYTQSLVQVHRQRRNMKKNMFFVGRYPLTSFNYVTRLWLKNGVCNMQINPPIVKKKQQATWGYLPSKKGVNKRNMSQSWCCWPPKPWEFVPLRVALLQMMPMQIIGSSCLIVLQVIDIVLQAVDHALLHYILYVFLSTMDWPNWGEHLSAGFVRNAAKCSYVLQRGPDNQKSVTKAPTLLCSTKQSVVAWEIGWFQFWVQALLKV